MRHRGLLTAAGAVVVFTLVAAARAGESAGFQQVAEITQPGDPDLVYVADIDGDQVPDLITSDVRSRTMVIRTGNGDGSFGSATEIQYDDWAVGSAVLDVEGDGDVDILVMHEGTLVAGNTAFPNLLTTDSLTILRNDGSGNLTAESLGTMGRGPLHVFSFDVDGDDDLDLVLGTGHGDSVLFNDGSGNFGDPAWLTTIRPTVSSIAADLDGDGDIELLGVRSSTYLIELDGSGGVSSQTELSGAILGGDSLVADVDGDGELDLISIAGGPPPSFTAIVYVHLNPGDGRFGTPTAYAISEGHYIIEAGDADDDGDIDIVTSGAGVGARVLLNDGHGGFSASTFVPHGDDIAFLSHAILADVQGDARPELLTVNLMASTVHVFEQVAGDPPVADTISPAEILPGQSIVVTLTGTGFADGADIDFGPGLEVGTITFVSSERIDVQVTAPSPLQLGTALGERTVTLRNPDARATEFTFSVQEGPLPAIASISPARVFAGGDYSFDVRGTDFDAGATVDLGSGVQVTETVRLGADRLVVSARVSASATLGARPVTVVNGTGRQVTLDDALVIDAPPSLDLVVTSAELRERSSGSDKLRVQVAYAANAFAVGDAADPAASGVTLRIGDPANPIVFTVVPGDSGWRANRKGMLVWSSRSDVVPRLKLKFDRVAGTLRVDVKKLDVVVPSDGAFRVDLAIGADRGIADATLAAWRRGFRLR